MGNMMISIKIMKLGVGPEAKDPQASHWDRRISFGRWRSGPKDPAAEGIVDG